MDDYIVKGGKRLRKGFTTGSCAAAAVKAAALMLLGGEDIERVKLTLPSGDSLMLDIEDIERTGQQVMCSVTKDAGDDPDVTHGIKIFAKVGKKKGLTTIDGGAGVGRVTREGLACRVGEAAINPVPRRMIEQALAEAAGQYSYTEGFEAVISVPEGEKIARSTFNARLGIIGGISILGTTGIVEPMSEAAIIDTIKAELDTRRQREILFLAPGNYGLEFASDSLGLNIDPAVKYSNYIGETLDYALYLGFRNILLIGHVGKLVKLAGGIMNTHSRVADCRNEIFAAHTALFSDSREPVREIMQAVTTDEIHTILKKYGLCQSVYESILDKILYHLNYRTRNGIHFELIIFSKENGVLMQTKQCNELIKQLKELEN